MVGGLRVADVEDEAVDVLVAGGDFFDEVPTATGDDDLVASEGEPFCESAPNARGVARDEDRVP
jgi:hypothetical protein